MSDEWTIVSPEECDSPPRSFEEKEEAFDQKETHEVLCETCEEGDVKLIPPDESKDEAPNPSTGTAEQPQTEADGGVKPQQPADIQPQASDIESQEEFVTDIAGVPSVFVKDMGTNDDPSPHVTKEGLLYLGRKLGYQIRAEPIKPSWEVDEGKVVYKGFVEDDDGRTWEDYGTASYGEEIVGDENLDELASTRATTRALRLATGAGMTSLEEIEDGASNAVKESDPEIIKAEEVSPDA